MNHLAIFDLKTEYELQKRDIDSAIKEILDKGSFFLGEEVDRFEKDFSSYIGCKHTIGTNSGTAALKAALWALGIGANDEVITTPFTFIAVAEAIVANQAKPVFVDIDEHTYNIDPHLIEKRITPKTKAVIVVHTYGHPCQMDAIKKITSKHKLKIIEDCSHAHGTVYKKEKVGIIGDVGCFSCFPTKVLGAFGDAGCVTTNNLQLASKIRAYVNHGRQSSDKYSHHIIGDTLCLDNLQAAILSVKLKSIDLKIADLYKKAVIYHHLLSSNPHINLPPLSNEQHSLYVYTIQAKRRNKLRSYLEKFGIHTGLYYPHPLHLQPSLKYLSYSPGDFPVSERVSKSVLSLPLSRSITEEKIKYICQKINSFYA